jgi:arylsulfatase A-like enzyme
MYRRSLLGTLVLAAALWALPSELAFAAAKPNVVLITLDSARADRMGFLASTMKLTPNLDRIARQSLVFERAYAQAALTVVSHASLLSGTYPQTHGATEFGAPLSASVPFSPDILHNAGYTTAAFVGSIELDPRNGLAPGFDRGFNHYSAGFRLPQPGRSRYETVERLGSKVVAEANAWLAENSQRPFFLWLHLSDPHAPYPSTYNAAITSADAAVGKLVAVLQAKKLYDDALIVVASDHGESLGSHGEETHGIFLYDETIHVPLLVKLPHNQNAGKRVRSRASLVDVAPTVLEVAAIPVPSQMQGQSLLRIAKGSSSADQPVYSRTDFPERAFGWSSLESWRAGKFLYVRAPEPELYDLATDPAATHNLAQSSTAAAETMAAQLDAFDGRLKNQGIASETGLTASQLQKLASLGYVGLQKSASHNAAAQGSDPKDGVAVANKAISALAFIADGKPDKAIATLRPILPGASKMYLVQFAMGFALAEQQQYSKAIEYLHNAIELQPDSTWAHLEMGASLMKSGDYKSAAVHLEVAASRLPKSAQAHSLLAEAYDHLGRADEAAKERTKAREKT